MLGVKQNTCLLQQGAKKNWDYLAFFRAASIHSEAEERFQLISVWI